MLETESQRHAQRYLRKGKQSRMEHIRLLYNQLLVEARESDGWRGSDPATWLIGRSFWKADSKGDYWKELFTSFCHMSLMAWTLVWIALWIATEPNRLTDDIGIYGTTLILVAASAIAGAVTLANIWVYDAMRRWTTMAYLAKKLRDTHLAPPTEQMEIPSECVPAYEMCRHEALLYIR